MDVVIIGAGLSGLTAAAVLHASGVNVQVLEADGRIGGRIHALRDPVSDMTVADLGPTWVWPKVQPVALRWLEILGAKTFEQYNEGDATIVGYGPAPRRQPLPGQDGMVRIVGGPTALIESLAGRIGKAHIQTSAPVTEISEDGPLNVAIHLATGEIITAQRVIISVPLRVAATTMRLPWAPPVLLDAMKRMPTWMSTHAKAVALYEKPFWRDEGLSGRVASRTGPLVEIHDHTGVDTAQGALFGFVGWPAGQRQAEPQKLRQAILDQLVECFGPAAAHPLDLTIQDWAMNRLIVTDLDASEPPVHPDVGPAVLRQSYLDGRIRFAVSEASERSPGLIEGALASGERAAATLLREAQSGSETAK